MYECSILTFKLKIECPIGTFSHSNKAFECKNTAVERSIEANECSITVVAAKDVTATMTKTLFLGCLAHFNSLAQAFWLSIELVSLSVTVTPLKSATKTTS